MDSRLRIPVVSSFALAAGCYGDAAGTGAGSTSGDDSAADSFLEAARLHAEVYCEYACERNGGEATPRECRNAQYASYADSVAELAVLGGEPCLLAAALFLTCSAAYGDCDSYVYDGELREYWVAEECDEDYDLYYLLCFS